jgi:hypothetical protein
VSVTGIGVADQVVMCHGARLDPAKPLAAYKLPVVRGSAHTVSRTHAGAARRHGDQSGSCVCSPRPMRARIDGRTLPAAVLLCRPMRPVLRTPQCSCTTSCTCAREPRLLRRSRCPCLKSQVCWGLGETGWVSQGSVRTWPLSRHCLGWDPRNGILCGGAQHVVLTFSSVCLPPCLDQSPACRMSGCATRCTRRTARSYGHCLIMRRSSASSWGRHAPSGRPASSGCTSERGGSRSALCAGARTHSASAAV